MKLTIKSLLLKLVDQQQDDSFAAKWRRERVGMFRSFVSPLHPPFSILDVGGTQKFWKASHFAEFAEERDVKIVLLNTGEERDHLSKDEDEYEATNPNFVNINGDARNMKEFDDNQFEVVFSNSVIEHVGNYDQQRQMAEEVRRVGERYFLQTPNRFFPIEPHFVFPFFQFLPLRLRVFLLCNFKIGAWDWSREISDRQTAVERASENGVSFNVQTCALL